jgi:cytochrome c biogenesis protein CcmG, thiol:disulfide interchange protein DsbE
MARYVPLVLAALLAAACGSAAPRSQAPSAAREANAFRGSPAPLAGLHAQADELLGGGVPGFRTRLRSLRGYPVVVNKWASWCGPCQTEFPAFQQAALRYGRRVAFMGVDAKDAAAAAGAFLGRFPVSYPSYQDPDENIARSIQASVYFPQTVYFDRRGAIVYDHAGPYATAAALERDIQRYVLR